MNANQKGLIGLLLAMLFQASLLILVPAVIIGGIVWAVWKWLS